jgi:cytochrome c biogenesis protein ResB
MRKFIPGAAVFVALMIVLQHAVEKHWGAASIGALSVAAGVLPALLWRGRGSLYARFTSLPMAVALLMSVAGATALGTFVPQNMWASRLVRRYGPAAAEWLQRLFINDLFGSYWFVGLMMLLALSLTLVLFTRPFWRARYWGFTLAHVGMVVVIAGAVVGAVFGTHGEIGLRVGVERHEVTVTHHGEPSGVKEPLKFALRLEGFDVERYPRFVVYSMRGRGQAEPVQEVKLREARKWTAIQGAEMSFRVKAYYPDAEVTEGMQASEDDDRPAVGHVKVERDGKPTEVWLAAGVRGVDTVRSDGLDVEFVWPEPGRESETAWMERTARARPAQHVLEMEKGGGRLVVEVGKTYTAPGTERKFRVARFIPDFYLNSERQPFSRSDEPNNPALQIDELAADGSVDPLKSQWLFGLLTGMRRKEGALPLKYTFEPAETAVANLVRIDGRAKQIVAAAGGKETARRQLEMKKAERLELAGGAGTVSVEVLQVFEHGEPKLTVRNRSEQLKNPAVQVEFQNAGEEEPDGEATLVGNDEERYACRLPNNKVLVFDSKEGEVKAYRSHVAVLEDGQDVLKTTIAVNAPLSYGGYHFYQSGWRANDLDYSGLKVVRDPGLGVVYAGLVMVCAGVLFTLYVRPRLTPRGAEPEREAGA